MAAFGELGVCDEITEGLEEIGWNLPTDIQAEAVPLIRDYSIIIIQYSLYSDIFIETLQSDRSIL